MKISDFWKFLKKSKNSRFSSKITKLSDEPQKRDFVVRSSKGHHSKGFCPYFHVFKLTIIPEVFASIRHTSLMMKNFFFNFFSPISLYSKLLRKYCIKTFPITLTLFFSKTSEKVGFLEKKVRRNPRHTAFCGIVPNCYSWEQVLEKKKASFKISRIFQTFHFQWIHPP